MESKLTNSSGIPANFKKSILNLVRGKDAVKAKLVQSWSQLLKSLSDNFGQRSTACKLSKWTKANVKVDIFSHIRLVCGESVEHLCCSLRVSKISNFIAYFSCFLDVFYERGHIIFSKLREAVFPVAGVGLWVESYVLSAVLVSSIIGHPYIVSRLSSKIRNSFIFKIQDERI